MDYTDKFFQFYEYLKNMGEISTYVELADILNTNKAGINDLKSGKKKLSLENILSMKKSYPILNLDWFASDDESMLLDKTKSEVNNNKKNVVKNVVRNVVEPKVQKITTNEEPPYNIVSLPSNRKTKDAVYPIQEIPLYDLEATAGLKELFSGGKSATQVLDTIKIPHLPKCDGAISITGDSMYPLLKSGDMVLYKEVPLDSIFYGEMYLLAYQIDDWEEYITVKYVQKSELGDDYLKLVSQNQHHQPRNVKKAQITAIAIIKASIRINTMM